jgi:hypothetical protein
MAARAMTILGRTSADATSDSDAVRDAQPWTYETGRFLALGHDFSVRTSDPDLGRYLDSLFGSLHSSGRAAHHYLVVDRGATEVYPYELHFDDVRITRTASPSVVLSVLLWHINRRVVEASPEWLLLHAAGAEIGGRAVLLPARMESGKTTLVAGLVRAGMRYLTDEAAALDPATLTIHPYPKPLSVDAGSWEVLSDLNPGEAVPALYRRDQWAVDVRSIRDDAIGRNSRAALIVSPRYIRGGQTAFSPLRKAEALFLLTENAFNLEEHGAGGFDALARLVRSCACYRLTVGDLDAACELVFGLFQADYLTMGRA